MQTSECARTFRYRLYVIQNNTEYDISITKIIATRIKFHALEIKTTYLFAYETQRKCYRTCEPSVHTENSTSDLCT